MVSAGSDFSFTFDDLDGSEDDLLDALIGEAIDAVIAQPTPAATEDVLYTCEVGDLILTVIKVSVDGRVAHQLYAVGVGGQWASVGLFGLFTDALSELATWRAFLGAGGSLERWMADRPEGVRFDRGSVTA